MTGEVHVHPAGDLIEHDIAETCPCGPTTMPVKRDDGSVGWLTVHHSLDGREIAETGDQPPPASRGTQPRAQGQHFQLVQGSSRSGSSAP
jgi:hypothetical protein